jgi:hypothetical protein
MILKATLFFDGYKKNTRVTHRITLYNWNIAFFLYLISCMHKIPTAVPASIIKNAWLCGTFKKYNLWYFWDLSNHNLNFILDLIDGVEEKGWKFHL